jgi:chromosomal replication initiation ATPase DnaA
MQQLRMDFGIKDSKTLELFVWSDNNQIIKKSIYNWMSEGVLDNSLDKNIFIYGEASCGSSHLLKACAWEKVLNSDVFYWDFLSNNDFDLDSVRDKNNIEFVFLNNIDCIENSREVTEKLFHALNIWKSLNSNVLIVSNKNVDRMNFDIMDLKTRLQQFLTFQMFPLSDNELFEALKKYANNKGWIDCESSIRYLIKEYVGKISKIFSIVDSVVEFFPTNKSLSIKSLKEYLRKD